MKKYLISAALITTFGVGFYTKVFIPKHTFETTHIQQADMKVVIEGIGNVDVKNLYKIGSLYGGQVSHFNIEEGEFVHKGDILAKVDSVDLDEKVQELKAMIKRVTKDITALGFEKESTKIEAEYQKEILKKNQNLYNKGAISELDFKKFKTSADIATLKISNISAKIDALYAQKQQFSANLDGLYERLKRYTIVAPIDGYITKKYISNFTIIIPNQPLVEIVNPKDVWVASYIDTRISANVKIGDRAKIKLRSSNKIYNATVKNIKPINNKVTYEREIDVVFDELPIPFYLQESANVKIMVETLKDIYQLPTNLLSYHNQKEGVWIVQGKTVHFKEVVVLAHAEKFVATKSLSSLESIVIPNPKKKQLKEGMKIYHD